MKIKTIGQLLDYVETEEKAIELINYINKQKEVLDNIKENLKNTDFEYLRITNNHCLADYLERLLELLEEIDE